MAELLKMVSQKGEYMRNLHLFIVFVLILFFITFRLSFATEIPNTQDEKNYNQLILEEPTEEIIEKMFIEWLDEVSKTININKEAMLQNRDENLQAWFENASIWAIFGNPQNYQFYDDVEFITEEWPSNYFVIPAGGDSTRLVLTDCGDFEDPFDHSGGGGTRGQETADTLGCGYIGNNIDRGWMCCYDCHYNWETYEIDFSNIIKNPGLPHSREHTSKEFCDLSINSITFSPGVFKIGQPEILTIVVENIGDLYVQRADGNIKDLETGHVYPGFMHAEDIYSNYYDTFEVTLRLDEGESTLMHYKAEIEGGFDNNQPAWWYYGIQVYGDPQGNNELFFTALWTEDGSQGAYKFYTGDIVIEEPIVNYPSGVEEITNTEFPDTTNFYFSSDFNLTYSLTYVIRNLSDNNIFQVPINFDGYLHSFIGGNPPPISPGTHSGNYSPGSLLIPVIAANEAISVTVYLKNTHLPNESIDYIYHTNYDPCDWEHFNISISMQDTVLTRSVSIYWVESYKTENYGYPCGGSNGNLTCGDRLPITSTLGEYRPQEGAFIRRFHDGIDFGCGGNTTFCYTVSRGVIDYHYGTSELLSNVKTDKFDYFHVTPNSANDNYLNHKIRNSGIPIASASHHIHLRDKTGTESTQYKERINPLRIDGLFPRDYIPPLDVRPPIIDWIRVYNDGTRDNSSITATQGTDEPHIFAGTGLSNNTIDLNDPVHPIDDGLDIVIHACDEIQEGNYPDHEKGVYSISYVIERDGQTLPFSNSFVFNQQLDNTYAKFIYSAWSSMNSWYNENPPGTGHSWHEYVVTNNNTSNSFIPKNQLTNGNYTITVGAEDIFGYSTTSNIHFTIINGSTLVQESINEDTTWDTDVVIGNNITIEEGVTLTIEPDINITFEGHYRLNVEGKIIANGTKENPILFTKTSQIESWNGINIVNSNPDSLSEFRYCIFEGSDISSDSLNYNGGVFYIENSSDIIIENCTFKNNKAIKGGAIYCKNSDPILINNIFKMNSANSGGAIYLENSDPVIIGNFICNNSATNGTGIIFDNSIPPFTNNTVINNFSDSTGCGLDFYSSSPDLINNIIWGNSNSESHNQVYIGLNSNPNFYYCDVEGGEEDFILETGVTYQGLYQNNIDNDPLLLEDSVPNSPQGFVLDVNSLCIDAGIPDTIGLNLPEFDIDGNVRIDSDSNLIDIGAYEYPNYPSVIEVSGILSEDSFWGSDTIKVIGDVVIPDSISLTIYSGVTVLFSDSCKIDINGSLNAYGIENNEIAFLPVNIDTGWGGLRFTGGSNNSISSLNYCSFLYGKATESSINANGGAISIDEYNNIEISHCIFKDNYSFGNGGSIYILNASPTLINNSISNSNSANYGGAIYLKNSDSKLISNTIYQNDAIYGGAVYIDSLCTPEFINNTIVYNSATIGGGLFCNSNSALPMLINTTLYFNTAALGSQVGFIDHNPSVYQGDEIYTGFYYCNIEGDSSAFAYNDPRDNRGKSLLHEKIKPVKSGKRIFGKNRDSRNQYRYQGNYINNISSDPLFVDMPNNNFDLEITSPNIDAGCEEDWITGGLSNSVNSGLLGYSAFNNYYDIGAFECLEIPPIIEVSGVISQDEFWRSETIMVIDSVVIENNATVTISANATVIFSGDFSISIEGCLNAPGTENEKITFTRTNNTWNGLKVLENGIINLDNCIIENSYSLLGGSIYTEDSGTLNISNCDFINNNASLGGVLYCNGSSITLEDCSFQSNSANQGGVIYNSYSDTLIVKSCNFFNNSAIENLEENGFGGIIYNEENLLFIGNQVYDNNAVEGGAIYQTEGTSVLLNNTICNNNSTSHGGALAILQDHTESNIILINNIIWDNSCVNDSLSTQIYNETLTPYIAFCDIQNFNQEILELPGLDGTFIGNIVADPVFVDVENRDYNLQIISPCINNGSPNNWFVNIPNNYFIISENLIGYQAFENHYDIGCFEIYNYAPLKVYPSSLEFGDVAIGDCSDEKLTLFNSGYNSILINSIEVSEGFEIALYESSNRGGKENGKEELTNDKSRMDQNRKSNKMSFNASSLYGNNIPLNREIIFPIEIEPLDSLITLVSFSPIMEQNYEGCLTLDFTHNVNEIATMNLTGTGFDEVIYITENTLWDADTVYVRKNTVVNPNVELTIDNDCMVIFGHNRKLTFTNAILDVSEGVSFIGEETNTESGLYFTPAIVDSLKSIYFNHCKVISKDTPLSIINSALEHCYIDHSNKNIYLRDLITSDTNLNINFLNGDRNDLVHIEDCDMSYTDYATLISISSYPNYIIKNNSFVNYNTALWINESGHGGKFLIENNEIYNNQYGYGIELYHSNAEIVGANNLNSNYIGIAGMRNCNISLVGNMEIPYQTVHNNLNDELVFDHDSFPIKFHHNIIYDELYPGDYLVKCIEYDPSSPFDYLDVRNNNWGNNFNPELDFYPSETYLYLPLWDILFGEYTPTSVEELYESAIYNFNLENYILAEQLFQQVISEFSETKYALYSAKFLISVEECLDEDFSSLQEYYNNIPNLYFDEKLQDLSEYLANYCNIKLGDYPAAIDWFESVILDPPSYSDSLYAVIDLGYTYLLMEGSRRSYCGQLPNLIPKSREEYLQNREILINELIERESNDNFSLLPLKPVLFNNYPNPFNPTTKISFSIPNDSKVNLSVYNIKGQKVRTLIHDDIEKGKHEIVWNSKDNNGKRTSSGVYFYKLEVNGKTKGIKKMLLLK